MPKQIPYGTRTHHTQGQLARAQELTRRYYRPPPRVPGPDPAQGSVPRRLAAAGKPKGKGGAADA